MHQDFGSNIGSLESDALSVKDGGLDSTIVVLRSAGLPLMKLACPKEIVTSRGVAQPEQAVLQSNKKLITHGPSQGHVVG